MPDPIVVADLALELEILIDLKQCLGRRSDSWVPEHALRTAEVLAESVLDARGAKELFALRAGLGFEGHLLAKHAVKAVLQIFLPMLSRLKLHGEIAEPMVHGLRFTVAADSTVLSGQALGAQSALAMGTLFVSNVASALLTSYETLDHVPERIYIADPAFLEV